MPHSGCHAGSRKKPHVGLGIWKERRALLSCPQDRARTASSQVLSSPSWKPAFFLLWAWDSTLPYHGAILKSHKQLGLLFSLRTQLGAFLVGLVESCLKGTGAKPFTKATGAEPRTKVTSEADWPPLLSKAPVIFTNRMLLLLLSRFSHVWLCVML